MTYCVALRVEAGLVMLSDTRTNAGLDNIGMFRKTFTYEKPGERAIALLCSGNLSVTQEVRTKLSRAMKDSVEDPEIETLLNCATMHRVAHLVGDAMKTVQKEMRTGMSASNVSLGASILVCGQRKGGKLRLYMVYSEGNFIEATADTPFFQIGEHKYGKPILDRMIRPNTSLSDAAKAVCVSMDSTLRSNLSVGMPLDLSIIPRDSYKFSLRRRIEANDPEFSQISSEWGAVLKAGFDSLPSLID
ncbi:peptidase T1 family protein [Sphingobium sp. SYK-6]|uniref:peptidase n=1 Tax=Sphingobium sp. (strain NBRC 103272 / SYK-6) TaxID=627192 RepID=UPI000227761E|nr:peptidase [Sphingobium sp. SYK-6]BAK67228.1 peptidase T1 family protein [Sphingobium sp. SYK-6]